MEHNKRMSDDLHVPPLNGTVARLVELAGAPLETPQQQQDAIRELIKLNLHSYIVNKQTLSAVQDALALLITERKSIIDKVIDKFLVPFAYSLITAIIYFVLKPP